MLLEHIKTVIADKTGILDAESIERETSIENLHIDDLDLADIYIMLEDFYDIEISEEHIQSFDIIDDIIEHIEMNASEIEEEEEEEI